MKRSNFNCLYYLLFLLSTNLLAAYDERIKVDQFGYLPDAEKIAIISSPKQGFNADNSFDPDPVYQLRREGDHTLLYSAALQTWQYGDVDPMSGDKVWWFDFSSVTAEGNYYLYDEKNDRYSKNFRIDWQIYQPVLKQALRTFFYQRANHAKQEPFAQSPWLDEASHQNPEQDTDCRLMNPDNPEVGDPATSRDLSGGWYDAGDYNKYVNYADGAVHELLLAYEENPLIWGDDWQFPESGNGVPDILDEIKWELDWLLRMQTESGAFLHKVASINWDKIGTPPSSDLVKRRYAPATMSATLSATGALAHAAIVYAEIPSLKRYASQLTDAAQRGWAWIGANLDQLPSDFNNAGFINATAEDNEATQRGNLLSAALYLYLRTGEAAYLDLVQAQAPSVWRFFSEQALFFEGADVGFQNAALYYLRFEPSSPFAEQIRQIYQQSINDADAYYAPLYVAEKQREAYRVFINYYAWGSNRSHAQAGNVLMGMNLLSPQVQANYGYYRNLASAHLHYLHGQNPLDLVYLTNMEQFGAERSVLEMYHLWFRDGSQWDSFTDSQGPPPGFLVGGVNANYSSDKVFINDIERSEYLLQNQPIMKRYTSWNTVDDAAYKLTENSITYQAPYIRLLSKLVIADMLPEKPALTLSKQDNSVSLQWYAAYAKRYTLFYAPYPQAEPILSLDMDAKTQLSAVLPPDFAVYVAIQAHSDQGNSEYSDIKIVK